jgi:hypothetical protein
MSDQPDEETDELLIANDRNYFKRSGLRTAARSIACFMLVTVFFGLSPCLKRQLSTGSGSG